MGTARSTMARKTFLAVPVDDVGDVLFLPAVDDVRSVEVGFAFLGFQHHRERFILAERESAARRRELVHAPPEVEQDAVNAADPELREHRVEIAEIGFPHRDVTAEVREALCRARDRFPVKVERDHPDAASELLADRSRVAAVAERAVDDRLPRFRLEAIDRLL